MGQLGIYLSGGVDNYAPGDALGGSISPARVVSLTPRRDNPMPSLRLDYVGPVVAPGVGTIEGNGVDAVRWSSPSGGFGAWVTVAVGATVTVYGDDDSYVIVERVGTAAVAGTERVQLLDTFGNFIGGSDFEELDTEKYRAGFVRNDGTENITGLKLWREGTMRIALETPSGGAIQTIANEDTAPTGVTWNSGEDDATGLTVATLTPGETRGLWIERDVADDAERDPAVLGVLHGEYTYDGDEYPVQVRGLHRVGVDYAGGAELQYELYIETAPVDVETDTPVATAAALPIEHSWTPAEGEYYIGRAVRNRWGLVSPLAVENEIVRIDADGEQLETRPAAPVEVEVVGRSVNALYFPTDERVQADRADTWLVWYTLDGTTPTDAGAPVEVPMLGGEDDAGREVLFYAVEDDVLDQTPVKALVKTARGEVESEAAAVAAGLVQLLGPDRPAGVLTLGRMYGQTLARAAGPTETVWIDQAENIRWEIEPRSLELWIDTVLVWRVVGGTVYVPSEWTLIKDAVSGSMADALVPIEASGTDVIYIGVNGSKVVEIDAGEMEIRAGRWTFWGSVPSLAAGLPNVSAEAVAWGRFEDTLLQWWSDGEENWRGYASVDADGMRFRKLINRLLSQAEVEAL